MVCTLLCLASFVQHNVHEIHLYHCAYRIHYIDTLWVICSPADKHLGCFLSLMNKTAVNIPVHVFV